MGINETLEYYNENARHFTAETVNVDFSELQNKFLNKLQENARILDFGCGAGRDTKYFLNKGFVVDAIDGSAKLCKMASEYTGIPVRNMMFQDLADVEQYDAIWACASILHLTYHDLITVMKKMVIALKENGVIYTSFKYGNFEGVRNGRYFIDMTEEKWKKILQEVGVVTVEEMWITSDVRQGREEEKWMNLILRKSDIN